MRIISIYLSLLIIIFLVSCTDIIESDLGEECIVIVAPSDGARNDEAQQTFLWEDLAEDDEIDLEFYNLQIAEPSFENANLLLLDTNITSPTYTFALEPGEYEWRVRGENANTKTEYFTHKLNVDTLFDLTNVELIIISPTSGSNQKLSTDPGNFIEFKWDRVVGADDYFFQLVKGSFDNNEKTLISKSLGNKTELNFFISRDRITDEEITGGEGSYEWRVIATDTVSNTSTSASSLFTVDTTRLTN